MVDFPIIQLRIKSAYVCMYVYVYMYVCMYVLLWDIIGVQGGRGIRPPQHQFENS
jgi:hypothetical protein